MDQLLSKHYEQLAAFEVEINSYNTTMKQMINFKPQKVKIQNPKPNSMVKSNTNSHEQRNIEIKVQKTYLGQIQSNYDRFIGNTDNNIIALYSSVDDRTDLYRIETSHLQLLQSFNKRLSFIIHQQQRLICDNEIYEIHNDILTLTQKLDKP